MNRMAFRIKERVNQNKFDVGNTYTQGVSSSWEISKK
jgi:hypothetical protein